MYYTEICKRLRKSKNKFFEKMFSKKKKLLCLSSDEEGSC